MFSNGGQQAVIEGTGDLQRNCKKAQNVRRKHTLALGKCLGKKRRKRKKGVILELKLKKSG